jgi:hypothetical protein
MRNDPAARREIHRSPGRARCGLNHFGSLSAPGYFRAYPQVSWASHGSTRDCGAMSAGRDSGRSTGACRSPTGFCSSCSWCVRAECYGSASDAGDCPPNAPPAATTSAPRPSDVRNAARRRAGWSARRRKSAKWGDAAFRGFARSLHVLLWRRGLGLRLPLSPFDRCDDIVDQFDLKMPVLVLFGAVVLPQLSEGVAVAPSDHLS